MSFQPSRYQQDIFDWVRKGKGNAVVQAVAGSGKCLGYGTRVVLFSGRTTQVQNIKVGDQLMGPDSRPRTVLSVTQGTGQLYRVVPTKGEPFVCNGDHILVLTGTNRFRGQEIEISVKEYMRRCRNWKSFRSQWKLFRPSEIRFPQRPKSKMDPYFVGIWLGDGGRGSTRITTPDMEVVEYLSDFANTFGLRSYVVPYPEGSCFSVDITGGMGSCGRPNPVRRYIRKSLVNSSGEKIIPRSLLVSGVQSRLRLLAGLLDSDGYYGGSHYEISSKWKGLSDGICFLARSLGFCAVQKVKMVSSNFSDHKSPFHVVNISGDLDRIPCKVKRKKAKPRNQVKRINVTGLTVETLHKGTYYGFQTDGDHRFLLGDFTVTHNSTTLVEIARLLPPAVAGRAIFLAFNKAIVQELGGRLPPGFQAKTVHSLAYGALARTMNQIRGWNVDTSKTKSLVRELYAEDPFLKPGEEGMLHELMSQTSDLVEKTMLTYTDPKDRVGVMGVANHFGIMLDFPDWSLGAVPTVVDRGFERIKSSVTFTELLYWSVVLNARPQTYDFILCDESQDLSKLQQQFILRMRSPTGRVIAVGDSRQAIYGFAGADCRSMDQFKENLGAVELPLSICYRCPTSHLDLAKQIVPHIEASPTASEGVVEDVLVEKFSGLSARGDLVICRRTAPLISLAFRLIRDNVGVVVKGRDIGKQLLSVLRKAADQMAPGAPIPWEELPNALEKYRAELIRKLTGRDSSESMVQQINDQIDCLLVLWESSSDLQDLEDRVDTLFSDRYEGNVVTLCTVHRAKGLEAERVFILEPDKIELPLQQEWAREQERNLHYVALTRSKRYLAFLIEESGEGYSTPPIEPEKVSLSQGDGGGGGGGKVGIERLKPISSEVEMWLEELWSGEEEEIDLS